MEKEICWKELYSLWGGLLLNYLLILFFHFHFCVIWMHECGGNVPLSSTTIVTINILFFMHTFRMINMLCSQGRKQSLDEQSTLIWLYFGALKNLNTIIKPRIECVDCLQRTIPHSSFLPIEGQKVWVIPPRAIDGVILKKRVNVGNSFL